MPIIEGTGLTPWDLGSLLARFPLPGNVAGASDPPVLEDWQFHYNGLTMGPDTSFGLTRVSGLNLATIRQQDQALPRDQGEQPGLDLYGGRDVELDFWMTGTGGLVSNQLALSEAMGLGQATELPLWFQVPSLPLLCVMCRVRKRDMDWDADFAAGAASKPTVQLHATDPRIYTAGQSLGIPIPVLSGGLAFPVRFPVTFGTPAPTTASVTNQGTMETRPLIIFSGPVTAPWMGNTSVPGNPTVRLQNPDGAGGPDVASGDQLVVDLGVPHRVLYYVGGILSGTTPAPVMDWVSSGSVWWDLVPGVNEVQYGSGDAQRSGVGEAQLVWASAYQL